jgi:hypothetical protein
MSPEDLVSEEPQSINVNTLIEHSSRSYLSEYFESLEYVKLETSEESLIGQIDNLAISDNYIVIYDNTVNHILLFSRDGKFIRKLFGFGKGPDEFITINSMQFTHDEHLFLMKNYQTICLYDILGNALKTKSFTNPSTGAYLFPNGNIAVFYPFPYYLQNDGFEITYTNFNGDKVASALFHPDYKNESPGTGAWSKYYFMNDTLCYWSAYTNTIKGLSNNASLNEKWVLDYGENKNKDDSDKEILKDFRSKLMITGWLECKDFIIVRGANKGYSFASIYDKEKKTGKRFVYNLDVRDDGFHNDIDGGYPFDPQISLPDGSVACIVEPGDFVHYTNTPYNRTIIPKQDNTKLKEILDGIEFSDNPIIIIAHEN